MSAYELELRGLTKAYGDAFANRGVDLRVRPGTIHALIGENGAGKSTAMKMLYGMVRPDAGEILLRGGRVRWRSPQDAIAHGIGMVHQHFMLAGPYTVLENIMLGAEPPAQGAWRLLPKALRPADRAAARLRIEALARQYGMPLELDSRIEELSVGTQQRVEILKLLYREARIMILDEPTAVLTPQESTELFANLRELKAQGRTIVIITHKLKEVLELADEITVLRGGAVAGTRKAGETDAEDLANLMMGRKVSLETGAPAAGPPGAPVLEVEGLRLASSSGRKGERPRLDGITLRVGAGEIVGLAGIEGNGQSELLEALLHPRELRGRLTGAVRILGRAGCEALSTAEIRALGVGAIAEDRHKEALLLERPLTENFALGLQREPPFSRHGLLSEEAVLGATRAALAGFDVRPPEPGLAAARLSGGNQQKLVVARELARTPRFLIAAQPTRGVDVGSIECIHRKLVETRDRGAGVLLVSSELDEILALSDRILVIFGGRIVAEFARGQADERRVGLAMGGGKRENG